MFNNNHPGYSAMGFVDTLGTVAATVTFAIEPQRRGPHKVTFRYANATGAAATATVGVGPQDKSSATRLTRVSFPDLADWGTWGEVTVTLDFAPGVNLLTVARTAQDVGAINLNYVQLQR
jgi:alpha-glucosidase